MSLKLFTNQIILLNYDKTNYFIILTNCANKPLKIYFYKESHELDQFYIIDNFKNNEESIKYLFEFTKNIEGWIWILTNKNGAKFEGNIFTSFDTTKQRFSFYREKESLKNKSIKVNFLKKKAITFQDEQGSKKIEKTYPDVFEGPTLQDTTQIAKLYHDFNTLNVNIVQNLLDFAELDRDKKEYKNYVYELYNKDKVKKVVITYRDYGEWFNIELL